MSAHKSDTCGTLFVLSHDCDSTINLLDRLLLFETEREKSRVSLQSSYLLLLLTNETAEIRSRVAFERLNEGKPQSVPNVTLAMQNNVDNSQ